MTDKQVQTEKERSLQEIIMWEDLPDLKRGLGQNLWSKHELQAALLSLATRNNVEGCRMLIDAGTPVTMYDIFDRSLLHITLHDGKDSRSLPVFHYALAAARQKESTTLCRSWVNLRGAMGYTALFYGCKAGLTECVTALIEAGADINKSSDFERLTPLMVAVKEGRLDTVRTLIRLGASVNKVDFHRQNALMHACLSGQPECARVLLEASANALCKNNLSQTPLMMAAKSGSEECVQLLLDKKPDLQVSDIYNRTAVTYAVLSQNLSVARLLMKRVELAGATDGHEGLLSSAFKKDSVPMMKMLLEHSWVSDGYRNMGMSPLHWAVIEAATNCMEFMLENHIHDETINARCVMGVAPLHLACQRHHRQLADLLIRHGADMDAPDEKGCTPLLHTLASIYLRYQLPATKYGVLRTLLYAGCDVSVDSRVEALGFVSDNIHARCSLPMEWAVYEGDLIVVEMLWVAGARGGSALELHHECLRELRRERENQAAPPQQPPTNEGNQDDASTTNSRSDRQLLNHFLKETVCQPRPLAHLCRIGIRKLIRPKISEKVESLPLPEPVKEFLLLPEMEAILAKQGHAADPESENDSWGTIEDSSDTDSFMDPQNDYVHQDDVFSVHSEESEDDQVEADFFDEDDSDDWLPDDGGSASEAEADEEASSNTTEQNTTNQVAAVTNSAPSSSAAQAGSSGAALTQACSSGAALTRACSSGAALTQTDTAAASSSAACSSRAASAETYADAALSSAKTPE